jgi:hypothetical protein
MQPADPAEFSRPLPLDRIGTTQHREEVTATDKERADLAERFSLLSLDSLSASFALKRVRKDLVRVKGHVRAELAQACVVTLDPVPARIDERFEVDFLEGVQPAVSDLELDAEAAEAPEAAPWRRNSWAWPSILTPASPMPRSRPNGSLSRPRSQLRWNVVSRSRYWRN